MDPGAKPDAERNKIPLYQVIKNHILDQIHSGVFEPESKIESENELATRFDVSRLTVQRAIRDLAAEGYLKRVQGAGTFVTPRSPQFSLFEVRDIADQSRAMGGAPTTEVLLQRRIPASEQIKTLMEFSDGTPVFQALLLQKNEDQPIAVEERYAQCDVFPDFLEQNFEQVSVYNYFAQHSKLEDIETVLQAVMPGKKYRNFLQLDENEPCLFLERRNWNEGRVVTLTRFTFAGTDFRLGSRYAPLGAVNGAAT